jgi:hypothetical protein
MGTLYIACRGARITSQLKGGKPAAVTSPQRYTLLSTQYRAVRRELTLSERQRV